MEPKELHPLKPLLLLLGWTHCYSCTEGRELLQTLWTDKVCSALCFLLNGLLLYFFQFTLCHRQRQPKLSYDNLFSFTVGSLIFMPSDR